MKKTVLFLMLAAGLLSASAEIRFSQLNNIKATNITLIDKEVNGRVEITDAVFYNGGKGYPAKQIRCDVVDGVATYRLKFKRHTVFKDCKLMLLVNGKQRIIDIQKALEYRETYHVDRP